MKTTTDQPEDLRFGVFGETGSGKTTLLSAYYGNLRSDFWAAKYGYSLLAEDPQQGHALIANYNGLKERNRFPAGSYDFAEYRFNLQVSDSRNPSKRFSCLRICWFDYPGKWWTNVAGDQGERTAQETALYDLLTCQVGILLFDGARATTEGTPYLRTVLANFRDQVERHRAALQQSNYGIRAYPTQWILALTKADLYPTGFSAKDFQYLLENNAKDHLNELGRAVGGCEPYCWTYLLLSSVCGRNGRVENVNQPFGLELIAPLALLSSMEKAVTRQTATRLMVSFLTVTDMSLTWVRRLQAISNLTGGIFGWWIRQVELMAAQKGIQRLRDRLEKAVRRGDVILATACAMRAQLAADRDHNLWTSDLESSSDTSRN